MDLSTALAGLDDHPWASVSDAYGPAEELPTLLRALAGDDGEAAEEALSELYSCVLHQGTVYPAGADAAPYLARIAAAGIRPADVLRLLGGLAGSEDEYGVGRGGVRAAVGEQLPLLLPLLADPDAAVRLTAAWAVGHTRRGGAVTTALRDRWTTETDPDVRAELLVALGRSDLSTAAAEADALLGDDTPVPVRLAAVLVHLDNREHWTAAHHSAALSLLPARGLTVDRYTFDRREPLHAIVDALLQRDTDYSDYSEDDRDAALALLEAALRDPRASVQDEALWAADHACRLSRSAPARLLPAVAALLPHRDAQNLLGLLGPLAADAAPALARLAAGPDDESADRALAALLRVDPRQAAPLLARHLDRRPRSLATAGLRVPAVPFDPDLLAAVRSRLATDGLDHNETSALVNLLRRWGPPAIAALPELSALLPRFPYAASAVAAVAIAAPPAEREHAGAVLKAATGPIAVARAHYDVTGDPDLLLHTITEQLGSPEAALSRETAEALNAAADLGPAAADLLPTLPALAALPAAALADGPPTVPQLDNAIATARALWQIDGDAEEAVDILAAVLDHTADKNPWHRWTVVRALRAAAALGTAGHPLVPRLERLLDDPEKAAAAALALVDIEHPDTVDPDRLAEAVLHAVETGADTAGGCEALHVLGPAALDGAQRGRVADLAETDRRITGPGLADELIGEDERLRALLAEFLHTQ
ncbi:HEAT repeat domain-containing protein [Kitasatospora sp. NPDC056184]|uniref:HEAT repeat domain-containing protein n=1 Tax=Kitasatospora sp. NPDC056184 TaxID=3345738 RepID=UPI0035D896ED